jgi:hypothetical protein
VLPAVLLDVPVEFFIGVIVWYMHVWIGFSSCISNDVFDLFRIDMLELILEFFLLFELIFVFFLFVVVFFIFIFDVIGIVVNGIIIIHSCNPISIMIDDAVSVLELKAFETLLVCHVSDSFDDNSGHWYLVDNVP